MGQDYFDFHTMKGQIGLDRFPDELAGDSFVLDLNADELHLSRRVALVLEKGAENARARISLSEALDLLTPQSREAFAIDVERLRNCRTVRTDTHLNLISNGSVKDLLVTVVPAGTPGVFLGVCSSNFDLMYEHDQRMESIVGQLEQAQQINQLILEGSTDYVYQLDLVRNTCTFSPKAMDVLPLESPTFSNAMDRLLGFIVPEDRNIFLSSFTPFLTGESQYHTAEYRVTTKTGEVIWISCHGKGIHDENGNPVMIAGSLMDITEQKRMNERIERMLYYDMLTGLKNRSCFERDMDELFSRNPDATGSILCVDIYNFKVFNEVFGQTFADGILREFAHILGLYINDNLGIYRLEGDEFLVHISESSTKGILDRLAPFQMYLSQARTINGHTIYIHARVGVAVYPLHGRTGEELIKNANTALQMHARLKTNQTLFFHSEVATTLSRRYELENELRQDIGAGMRNFRLVYQPVIELRGDKPLWHGAEALLRYVNPALGELSQAEVIETLEMTDMIIPVGQWVIEEATKECGRWHKLGLDACVNVNVSAQQISDPVLVGHISRCCARAGVDPRMLVCELTETALVDSMDMATRLCGQLKAMGVGVALDDFGSGYSSFGYLRQLPITQIKVDRQYVQQLETEAYHRIILRCLCDLSRELGLGLCVEGVEEKGVAQILSEMGVPLMQGFYFDAPLEADVFRRELLSHAPTS